MIVFVLLVASILARIWRQRQSNKQLNSIRYLLVSSGARWLARFTWLFRRRFSVRVGGDEVGAALPTLRILFSIPRRHSAFHRSARSVANPVRCALAWDCNTGV